MFDDHDLSLAPSSHPENNDSAEQSAFLHKYNIPPVMPKMKNIDSTRKHGKKSTKGPKKPDAKFDQARYHSRHMRR